MLQAAAPAPSTQDVTARLGDLRAKAADLKLRASDLEVRKGQVYDQRRRLDANADHTAIDKQIASAEHDLASTRIQLETLNQQIDELQSDRDLARILNQPARVMTKIATTAPPPPPMFDSAVARERERMIGAGAFIVLVPLVVALSRRIWHRGGPRPVVDLENSPRLQRMEQAIESIALEVERIGEAQRFTTKLLAERQPDAMARVAARKEPGTITPH
jgi:phage shock protein A